MARAGHRVGHGASCRVETRPVTRVGRALSPGQGRGRLLELGRASRCVEGTTGTRVRAGLVARIGSEHGGGVWRYDGMWRGNGMLEGWRRHRRT
jgi:hypothetical protein